MNRPGDFFFFHELQHTRVKRIRVIPKKAGTPTQFNIDRYDGSDMFLRNVGTTYLATQSYIPEERTPSFMLPPVLLLGRVCFTSSWK